MRKKIIGIVSMVSIVFLVGCSLFAWRTFTSPEGKFSISMPGQPTVTSIIIDTAFGPTYLNAYMLDSKDGFYYAASFMDHYPQLFEVKSVERILDDSRDGAVANVQGKLLGESAISIKKHPGREIVFESADGKSIVKARLYIVGERFYQIMATTSKEKQSSYNLTRFLKSFRLL
jgi:hypothetical protein